MHINHKDKTDVEEYVWALLELYIQDWTNVGTMMSGTRLYWVTKVSYYPSVQTNMYIHVCGYVGRLSHSTVEIETTSCNNACEWQVSYLYFHGEQEFEKLENDLKNWRMIPIFLHFGCLVVLNYTIVKKDLSILHSPRDSFSSLGFHMFKISLRNNFFKEDYKVKSSGKKYTRIILKCWKPIWNG